MSGIVPTNFYGQTSSLIEDIHHGFLGVSAKLPGETFVEQALRTAEFFGAGQTITLNQIHSANILDLRTQRAEPNSEATADALILPFSEKGVFAAIKTADCIPIIIASPTALGLVHAGWRGVSLGILEKVITAIDEPTIRVAFGPAAGKCCYEVGREVVDQLEINRNFDHSHKLSDDKYIIDLRGIAAKRLAKQAFKLGVKLNVQISTTCTICDYGYFSYRRSVGCKERNMSYLVV